MIKVSNKRLCDMCVYVCERKRERDDTVTNTMINMGWLLTILESITKLQKYPQWGIYTTHVQGCTCGQRLGFRAFVWPLSSSWRHSDGPYTRCRRTEWLGSSLVMSDNVFHCRCERLVYSGCLHDGYTKLASERADASESLPSGWSSSYSGILPLPLSDFELGRDVLSSREGSCGPLSCAELGLSFGRGFGRISSSEMAFNSSSIGLDRVESSSYHDADSSITMSRLTWTARVQRLKDLYAMRIHFSDFVSSFSRFAFGMRTLAMVRILWGARGHIWHI